MDIFLFKLTYFLYIAGTVFHIANMFQLKRGYFLKIGSLLMGVGFSIHSMALVLRYIEAGYTPVTNLFECLSFFSWTIMAFTFIILLRLRNLIIGSFTSPMVTVMIILASLQKKEILPLPPVLKSYWFPAHVIFSFLGDAIFALAFCGAIMYFIQENRIRSKRGGKGISEFLPSLEALDQMNYLCLSTGFPMLTLGIITGSIWASYAWGSYWSWDPKETWSLITWLIYAILLHQRLNAGWRGKKAALLSILGFFVILFTFLGVNLLVPGRHIFTS
jgi:cytochrome c-type biogenesis protein CcsB